MRLVSALYADYHPWNGFGFFDSSAVAHSPADLQPGDVLILHGGGDISPSLYGHAVSTKTGADAKPSRRDAIEWALAQQARAMNIPIIGICRGGQMLTALAGGYLIQHVNNHTGYGHEVETNDGEIFAVNSIHHQMMVPPSNGEYELVGWSSSNISDVYITVDENGNDEEVEVNVEPEFIYYPDFKGFAIQWHPEGMGLQSTANQYLKRFMENKL